ncbi:MAG: zinc-ribbon domain-containing protein, partial [Candidatus Bathyarchaeia archaeon]
MVKRCQSCGYNNRDDAGFCSSCGASIAGGIGPSTQCFYHPNLPAVYVCNRCGRAICRDDSKNYMDLVLCPQCYQGIVPMAAPSYAPQQPQAPSYA